MPSLPSNIRRTTHPHHGHPISGLASKVLSASSHDVSPLLAPGPAPRESTVSVEVIRRLVEAVERSGIPRGHFVAVAGIDPAHLEAPEARVARAETYRLTELAYDLVGDPAFGLHWAERIEVSTFGPIAGLASYCASLRQVFESLARSSRLVSDSAPFKVVEDRDKVLVCCMLPLGESAPIRRFVAEMKVGGFMRMLRAFSPHVRPERVSFEYPAPSYRSEYARIFEHAERFDEPVTGVVIDAEALDRPLPLRDEELYGALQDVVEQRLARMTKQTPYAARVRDLLVHKGWPRGADMPSIACWLGISVRSLRRYLAAEGTTYSQVLGEALGIIARQLLRDRSRTLQEIGYLMGFANANAFYRAFKRWTSTTPSAYRESLLAHGKRG